MIFTTCDELDLIKSVISYPLTPAPPFPGCHSNVNASVLIVLLKHFHQQVLALKYSAN